MLFEMCDDDSNWNIFDYSDHGYSSVTQVVHIEFMPCDYFCDFSTSLDEWPQERELLKQPLPHEHNHGQ